MTKQQEIAMVKANGMTLIVNHVFYTAHTNKGFPPINKIYK